MPSDTSHWNSIFGSRPDDETGWYEADAAQTLKFLGDSGWDSQPLVFLPGAGTSILVQALLEKGVRLVLNDISDVALVKLRQRVVIASVDGVWVHHDMALRLTTNLPMVDWWIDRAVLHFLLEEEQISGYFDNLKKLLRPGGRVLFAEFSPDGAPKCAGLSVHRYSSDELSERLGPDFVLGKAEPHVYTNPFGEPRPYIYALYRRVGGTGIS